MDGSRALVEILESRELLDRLATVEHGRWAHWQRYMHGQCIEQDDGSLLIPRELVVRWERQMATPYAELTREEQRSDQEQVHKYLPLIIEALG